MTSGVREPRWDNVRFLSGTLVVIGHTTESLAHSDGLRWLYVATWPLRVPVFVLLAGYFSSAGPLDARELRRLSESVLLPYLVIGLLHTLQLRAMYGDWNFFLEKPAWALWFLLALLAWRMVLPYVAVLRFPLLITTLLALTIGLAHGFGESFSASRIVCYLPFFLLGWKLRQGGSTTARLLRARWTRNAAVCVLAVTAAAGWVLRYDVDIAWLAMRSPYAEMSAPPGPVWAPIALRAVVLLGGGVVALSLVRLVPARRLPLISYLGAGGLYIYLLHPLAVRPLTVYGDVSRVGPWPEQLALIALAVALAAALGSPPVRKLARPLVQPRLPWLYAEGRRPRGRHGGQQPRPSSRPPSPAHPQEETLR
ncbi:acyltransferase family protein, partial [Streptomyces boncukensis]